ncbi:hypothetical protein [Streptomyces sp. NPDC050507]|uniref:hypothetical protein n=1 Tax=Streptomyces sp. NPDC050507 TaxID=3365619 RepID=UPI00379D6B72
MSFQDKRGVMINVRGATVEEFSDNLDYLNKGGAEYIKETVETAYALGLIRDELGGKFVAEERRGGASGGGGGGNQRTGGSAPQAAAQAAPDGAQAPSCRHGEKVFKSGISAKNNREWKAWDCPQGYRAGDCAREFIPN